MKKYLIIGTVFLLVPIFYVITMHSLMVHTAKQVPPKDVDHVMVLGAKLNGDVMSLSLYYRMLTALTYLQENDGAKVIVSGGQGEGEWISEAEAMARYLVEQGIAQERIILEDVSTNTFENFTFSREILGEEVKEIVVVTNDFHLFRSTIIAKRLGFEPYPLAAETPWVVKGKLWTREYLAIIKTWVFDRL
ncbi:YdcF family protein [Anaerobacillus alkaliphilus]|uniref:YdcF family protein n=1 Tax=Anaerobacillus alkaliphilus TaxID=1548597 RepID=A0A4Q0VQH4_9BACI|nr:YdcF family protein [Anaerobacillus alkaliphilus]RXI98683.1 YdcF family protein [Anaerobacillus alkaliphilus]